MFDFFRHYPLSRTNLNQCEGDERFSRRPSLILHENRYATGDTSTYSSLVIILTPPSSALPGISGAAGEGDDAPSQGNPRAELCVRGDVPAAPASTRVARFTESFASPTATDERTDADRPGPPAEPKPGPELPPPKPGASSGAVPSALSELRRPPSPPPAADPGGLRPCAGLRVGRHAEPSSTTKRSSGTLLACSCNARMNARRPCSTDAALTGGGAFGIAFSGKTSAASFRRQRSRMRTPSDGTIWREKPVAEHLSWTGSLGNLSRPTETSSNLRIVKN